MPDTSGSVSIRKERSPRRFLDVQRQFYRGDPHYVPPLTLTDRWQIDRRKNPFFDKAEAEFFVAERQGEIVGRISACRNQVHDQFYDNKIGFFGHFEARDQPAAHALLDTAARWLREHGASHLRGPIDLSTNYRCGLLIDGEPGPPRMMMPYNPSCYRDYLESYGLEKAKDLLALWLYTETLLPKRLARLAERIRQRTGATIRPIDKRRFGRDTQTLWQLYNRIWERNWGFVPMSKGEFLHNAKEFKLIAVPEMIVIVEVDGQPIGFGMNLPDVNVAIKACDGRLLPLGWWKFLAGLRRTRHARFMTLGIIPEYRKNGIDALLLLYYLEHVGPAGYPESEASWILEDNFEMLRVLESFGARPYRRYRIFEKPLAGGQSTTPIASATT